MLVNDVAEVNIDAKLVRNQDKGETALRTISSPRMIWWSFQWLRLLQRVGRDAEGHRLADSAKR